MGVIIVFYGSTGFLGLIGNFIPQGVPGAVADHERDRDRVLASSSPIAIAIFRAFVRMSRNAVKLLFAELAWSLVTTMYNLIIDAPFRDRFVTPSRLILVFADGYALSVLIITLRGPARTKRCARVGALWHASRHAAGTGATRDQPRADHRVGRPGPRRCC